MSFLRFRSSCCFKLDEKGYILNSSARQEMISKSLFIINRFGEKLEACKEHQEEKRKYPTVLFVPGLAMDLHEWDNNVLVLHGGLDTKVSIRDAQLLYNFAQGRKNSKYIPRVTTALQIPRLN